jgi:hypothetical protein
VNLGNDADITGAIYGQLAGANYGLPGTAKPWQTKVAKADLFLQLADQLAAATLPSKPSSRSESGHRTNAPNKCIASACPAH